MSCEGWFKMHRGWRDNSIFRGEYSRADAWVWLIENASWKPTRHDVKGKSVTLDRGQLCVSRERLADVWGWSPSAVERFLTRLKTEQMIGRETGQGKSVITICNYAKYQDRENETGQEIEQEAGQESDRERTAKEEGKKVRIEEGEIAKAIPPRAKHAADKPYRMQSDWMPGPLPSTVAVLVELWPPGRLAREVEQFRDFWLDRTDRRPGWDRTFHNRIRDIHDRVLRENGYGRSNFQQSSGNGAGGRDNRDGIAKALDRRLAELEQPAGQAGRYDDPPVASLRLVTDARALPG